MLINKLLTKTYIKLFAIFSCVLLLSGQVYAKDATQIHAKDDQKSKLSPDTIKLPEQQHKKQNKAAVVGIIDYEILFNESNQGKKVIQELKDKYEPLHLNLKNKNRELADSEKKLQIDKPSLSLQEFQRESIKIKQGYELLQIDEQIFQNSRVRDEENARIKMQKEIEGVIKIVSESLHLDFVIERSVALYMNSKIDITRDVLRELNKVSK